MITIGLLGCGNIGRIIGEYKGTWKIVALYDLVPEKAGELAGVTGGRSCADFESFIRADFDLVVEAASVKAVRTYAESILRNGKDLVILSVGALADPSFRDEIVSIAGTMGRRVYIPSGAICGLDNLKVARISPLTRLLLRTTKSPASLGIAAAERTLVFQGKANECIKEFPRNVNVSVALSLACGRDADVELYVDPAVKRNVHEIYAEGAFGDLYIRVSNLPSPDNPATSYLAALSILSLLDNIGNPLVVGT
ncbi:MAG TPA: aspartate dehydrogenase [Methanoregulaceae archaeon]|nr:MAG: aspartate dehydrogenase [Methanolinea sp.]HON81582.1 aspartate dehydrogenase [Methanoregulaceae archaeon]HPD10389.1 aspartate dehydrogenase [Methanoregulaceae archaeon]HRT15331.1 aspartate dehydrogenase [Methanoregulaceae archaeon]HRU30981.1 aspartate dehydrogenase [Methanoregulaceae archaeon]